MWTSHSTTLAGPSGIGGMRKPVPDDQVGVWRAGGYPAGRILCVADGLGSATKASEAASLALGLARQYTTMANFSTAGGEPRNDGFLLRNFMEVTGRVQTEFLSQTNASTEYGTTLAIVLVVDRSTLLVRSWGDSLLIVGDSNGETPSMKRLLSPERAETLSGTSTLNSQDPDGSLTFIYRGKPFDSVFLSTDGLEFMVHQPLGPGEDFAVTDAARRIVEYVRDQRPHLVDALLAGEDASWQARKSDDCGISVVAWKEPRGARR